MSISEKPARVGGPPPDEEQVRWPFLQQPRRLIVYMGLLLALTLFLFGMAVALYTPTWRDAGTFAALVLCAACGVEAIRRLGLPAGVSRDLLGAWWFPAILLLPPVYALLLPVPVFVMMQLRSRRALVHRRVFNTIAVALSGFLASVTWHGVQGDGLVAGLVGTSGAHESLTTVSGVLGALLCCSGFTVLNTLFVVLAARMSNGPGESFRPMWDREALMLDAVELCVGVTVAVLANISLLLLVIAVPPVLLLQRSLLYNQLQAAARTDPKTGLLNASTWEQEAAVEIARARSERGPAAVLILDIDHFKRVNDNHGHLFGDQVLLGVATTIAQQLRQSDLLGRFGGEEFVVLLPGSDTTEAWRAAERLRSQVGDMEIAVDEVPVSITVSVGVAVIGEHGNDLVELLTAADLALYRAKETGRNRVCLPAGRPGTEGRIPGAREGAPPGRIGPRNPSDQVP